MGTLVYKFGGASLKDAAGIRRMSELLRQIAPGNTCWVVVSAMGKTTNALEKVVDCLVEGRPANAHLPSIFAHHQQVISDLFPADHAVHHTFNNLWNQWLEQLPSLAHGAFDQIYDQVVSMGENLSVFVFSTWCTHVGLPAYPMSSGDWLVTDDRYREARVDFPASALALQEISKNVQAQIHITQGFVGKNPAGYWTTLGREGSDYSAAILGYLLDAKEVTIWKDVAGVLNADPQLFPHAAWLPELSYRDTIELAYFGASVIHPRTLQPLQQKQIVLRVASFMQPQLPGTRIHEKAEAPQIPAIIVKQNQVLVTLRPIDFSFVMEEITGQLFHTLAELKIRVNLIQHSAVTLRLCLDYDPRRLRSLQERLTEKYFWEETTGLALVTLRWYTPDLVSDLQKDKPVLLSQQTAETLRFITEQPPAWNSRSWS
jgi:aspartate kinase